MKQLLIIGNLGADAELKVLNGRECVTFRVADTESYTNSRGEKVENTTWYDCVLNNRADNLMQYLHKGTKVMVQGLPNYRIYDSAKYHAKMVGVQVSVQRVELVGGSNDSVPRYLFDEQGNTLEVIKFYFLREENIRDCIVRDKNLNEYEVNGQGFVFPHTPSQSGGGTSDGEPF